MRTIVILAALIVAMSRPADAGGLVGPRDVKTYLIGVASGITVVCLTSGRAGCAAQAMDRWAELQEAFLGWTCWLPRRPFELVTTDFQVATVRPDDVSFVATGRSGTEVGLPGGVLRVWNSERDVRELLGPCWSS